MKYVSSYVLIEAAFVLYEVLVMCLSLFYHDYCLKSKIQNNKFENGCVIIVYLLRIEKYYIDNICLQ